MSPTRRERGANIEALCYLAHLQAELAVIKVQLNWIRRHRDPVYVDLEEMPPEARYHELLDQIHAINEAQQP